MEKKMELKKGVKVKSLETGKVGTIIFYAYYTNTPMSRDLAEHIHVEYEDGTTKCENFDGIVIMERERTDGICIQFSWQDVKILKPNWTEEECQHSLNFWRQSFQDNMTQHGNEVLSDIIT